MTERVHPYLQFARDLQTKQTDMERTIGRSIEEVFFSGKYSYVYIKPANAEDIPSFILAARFIHVRPQDDPNVFSSYSITTSEIKTDTALYLDEMAKAVEDLKIPTDVFGNFVAHATEKLHANKLQTAAALLLRKEPRSGTHLIQVSYAKPLVELISLMPGANRRNPTEGNNMAFGVASTLLKAFPPHKTPLSISLPQ